ncbi:hypothetical protein AHAS_Ahas14G0004900 [Arachis hypogaea]
MRILYTEVEAQGSSKEKEKLAEQKLDGAGEARRTDHINRREALMEEIAGAAMAFPEAAGDHRVSLSRSSWIRRSRSGMDYDSAQHRPAEGEGGRRPR